MALPTRNLFVDQENNAVYRNFGDFSAPPTLYLTCGDVLSLNIIPVRLTGDPTLPMEAIDISYVGNGDLNTSIGLPGQAPVYFTNGCTAMPTPTISVTGTLGSAYTYTTDQNAQGGSFTITLTKSSPALSVTTAAIVYPCLVSDIQTAVQNAVNGAAGWSACSCTIVPTSQSAGNMTIKATYSSVVYTFATSSVTATMNSSLYGFQGKKIDLVIDDGDFSDFLAGSTSKEAFIEIKPYDESVLIQYPVIVRDNIATNP